MDSWLVALAHLLVSLVLMFVEKDSALTRNLRMTLAYDGTRYVGWQVQANGLSVQTVVTKAIKQTSGEDVNVLSAGRTDSGVHALGQVASFRTESRIPPEGFRKAIQNFLPDDIQLRDVSEVGLDFHATFSAKSKRYRYVIHNSRVFNPFYRHYAWHYHAVLDSRAMHEAAQELVGTYDFRSFESKWPNKATSVRTIMELTVKRQRFLPNGFSAAETPTSPEDAGDFIWVEIVGDGFLYNMVRTIVGTLIPVGRGIYNGAEVRRIRDVQRRPEAGDTAPAHGLYMVEVYY